MLGVTYALTYVAYAVIDVAGDIKASTITDPTVEDPVAQFLTLLNLVASIMSQSVGAPYDLFGGEETWNTAEGLEVASWGVGFLPLAAGAVYFFGSANKAIAEFNSETGILLTTFLGLVGISLGVCVAVETFSHDPDASSILSAVQSIVSFLPTLGKFLLTINDEFEGVPLVILSVLDLVCDLANGALGCAADVTSA